MNKAEKFPAGQGSDRTGCSSHHAKILLVYEHATVRKSLKLMLENQQDLIVVGEASDGKAGLALVKKLSPDIVVMGVTMAKLNGIEATRRISQEFPKIKVIALSVHSDKHHIEGMLQAGAAGYILKESASEELLSGIRTVLRGEDYFSPAITGTVLSLYKKSLQYGMDSELLKNEILSTKLHQPALPEKFVHRQRLIEKLEQHRHLPIQLIIAPAGYGKTIVASCWFEHTDWPSAWFSVDENDNDLRQFLTYFSHAIQGIFPGALARLRTLLSYPNLPPNTVLANILLNELEEISQDFILALDDFHTIKDTPIHDLLSQLLDYPPHNMHLLLISRRETLLPVTSLRVTEKLNEIRLHDLKFTEQETADFFQQAHIYKMSAASIKDWSDKTEGWVTALHLAVLSMSHRGEKNPTLAIKNAGSQYVMEYLFSETLAQQELNFQRFLIQTSIVKRFCGYLFNAICFPDSDAEVESFSGWDFIHKLQNLNLFVINLDEKNIWFRYHHLFQELLRNQLKRQYSPQDINELHARASQWFEQQGLFEEAIEHAMKASDMDSAVRIVDRYRRIEQDKDHWRNIEKWLAIFPVEIKQQRPELLLSQAWVWHDSYQLKKIVSITERLEVIMAEQGLDDIFLGELRFFQGVLLFRQGKGELSLKMFTESRERVPEKHPRIFGLVEIYFALSLYMTRGKQVAFEEINTRIQHDYLLNAALHSRLLLARSFLYMLCGELAASAQDACRIQSLSSKNGIGYMQGWGEYIQGISAFRCYNLEKALVHFTPSIEHRHIMYTRAAIDAMVGLALTFMSIRQPRAASDTVEQLLQFARETGDPQLLTIALSGQARVALVQGHVELAKQWLQSFDEDIVTPLTSFWLEEPSITKARVLLRAGSAEGLQQACDLLEVIVVNLRTQYNTCQMIEIFPLLALTYYQQGRAEEAFDCLKEVVSLSRTENWITPFIELGLPMLELLEKLLESDDTFGPEETAYIKKILSELKVVYHQPQRDMISATCQAMIEPLSKREIQVLFLLTQRLSNQEISDKLFISTETVKSHLKSVYAKFCVGKRKDAVAKAYEFKLFEH